MDKRDFVFVPIKDQKRIEELIKADRGEDVVRMLDRAPVRLSNSEIERFKTGKLEINLITPDSKCRLLPNGKSECVDKTNLWLGIPVQKA